ncbi:MAG: hypothetical protein LIO79_00770 [Rikenellaceae bacterium]|nr:hypothetical protein [Rikenellaceae bacterium]
MTAKIILDGIRIIDCKSKNLIEKLITRYTGLTIICFGNLEITSDNYIRTTVDCRNAIGNKIRYEIIIDPVNDVIHTKLICKTKKISELMAY